MKRRRYLWRNPIIVKEIRARMRGARVFILLTAHLIILGSIVSLVYLFFQSISTANNSLEERRFFGKIIFGLLIWLELVTISFIAPALTSTAISGEKERKTFDLLRITPLPAQSLVLGKYLAGVVFVFLLLITSIPLQSPAFIIGGVLPEEIMISTLILVVTALTFSAIGIFLSCIFSRSLFSTVLAYTFAIFLMFGIPMILLVVFVLVNTPAGFQFDQINLVTQVFLAMAGWLIVSLTPLGTIIATEYFLLDQQNILLASIQFSDQWRLTMPSPWLVYLVIYSLLSVFLLWMSIQVVKRGEK